MNEDDELESDLSSAFSEEKMDTHVPSPKLPEWDEPLKAKIGAEGMRKLREMQSSFFGERRKVKVDVLSRKRRLETGAFFREAGEEEVRLEDRAVKVSQLE